MPVVECPSVGICLVFLHEQIQRLHLWQESPSTTLPSHSITRGGVGVAVFLISLESPPPGKCLLSVVLEQYVGQRARPVPPLTLVPVDDLLDPVYSGDCKTWNSMINNPFI